jgi:hypothetical protein
VHGAKEGRRNAKALRKGKKHSQDERGEGMEIPNKKIEREQTKTRKRTSACEEMRVWAHPRKPARKLGEQTRPFFFMNGGTNPAARSVKSN